LIQLSDKNDHQETKTNIVEIKSAALKKEKSNVIKTFLIRHSDDGTSILNVHFVHSATIENI